MTTINELIQLEAERQWNTLMMIPSENYTYKEVREAVGSVLSHKYSEGYSGKRYYQGNEIIDQIENISVNLAKELFGTPHANVQALSGSPANAAVYMGLLTPGDTIMGMDLSSGGHLTHGHPRITFSGKFFKSVQYGVNVEGYLDYEALERLALEHKPHMIVAGTTAYARTLDWEKFAKIAEQVNALLLADISHIAGLVVSDVHSSPVPHVHIVTTTTHKTLRGPRGALIMVTQKGLDHDPEMAKKIDRAVFPGLQGGPHDNVTAGIGIALENAQSEEFKLYAQQTVRNAQALANHLKAFGYTLVTGGTDNHLLLVDLRNKNISGKDAAVALEKSGIVVNANSIPHDPSPPMNPSGIRLGTPALTVRGMKEAEMVVIADLINKSITNYNSDEVLEDISVEVKSLLEDFQIDF